MKSLEVMKIGETFMWLMWILEGTIYFVRPLFYIIQYYMFCLKNALYFCGKPLIANYSIIFIFEEDRYTKNLSIGYNSSCTWINAPNSGHKSNTGLISLECAGVALSGRCLSGTLRIWRLCPVMHSLMYVFIYTKIQFDF